MANYIDIILTKTGTFCVAPPWEVSEGDMVCLKNVLTDEKTVQSVISVVTDKTDGDYIKQIEKYIGCPLPKITEKYKAHPITWREEDVQE